MKRKMVFVLVLLIISVLCVSCSSSDEDKTVKIAVMGEKDNFYPDYEAGIKQAIADLNDEYTDRGFSFEYSIYDDDNSYEKGAQIIDKLKDDDSVTAVVGSLDMEINTTAAYMFNESKRLFVIPYVLKDSVYEINNYKTVFSLANSGKQIGSCLEVAAVKETNAKRWAVCAGNDEFSMAEMRGFMQKNGLYDDIQIVDCNDIVTLMTDFDNEMNRWVKLGVDGVVLFPGSSYSSDALFELLKRIRTNAPNIICMGDSNFDDSSIIESDEELGNAIKGFVLVADFYKTNDDKSMVEKYNKMQSDYENEHGTRFDLWYLQAYNMIRMIGDKAAEHNTNDSTLLAEILHKDGYNGVCQKFVFDENGSQMLTAMQYFVLNNDGTAKEINVR